MHWKAQIYGKKENNYRKSYDFWASLKKSMARRLNYICEGCRKKHKINRLSVHHIIPRGEAGTDDPDNLMLLCKECHDYIEELRIWNRRDIHLVLEELYKKEGKIVIREIVLDNDWHKWVYGSRHNPGINFLPTINLIC